MSPRRLNLILVATVCIAAQFPARSGYAQLTIQGVYVDAEGVLRARKVVPGRQAALPRNTGRDSERAYVSLPRLFAGVREAMTANERLPQQMQYLDGLVRLTHVLVLPGERDLVIVGEREQWDARDSFRPRGTRTGRPVFQLDDLVVALRHIGPGSRNRAFGCTLEQDDGAAKRVAALQSKLGAVPAERQHLVSRALKEAIGPLQAKFFGVPADTRFAYVAIEADYIMKRFSLGLDPFPIAGVRSYAEQSTGGSLFNRFWFTADYEPLLMSEDGNTYELRGRGLRLLASDGRQHAETNNAAATRFAEDFTKNLPRLELQVPAIADLHNLSDLAVLAALIAEDQLHERIGWDLGWILDEREFPIQPTTTPREAETLVTASRRGRLTVTLAGGVQVLAGEIVKQRQTGTTATLPRDALPIDAGQWSAHQTADESRRSSTRRFRSE